YLKAHRYDPRTDPQMLERLKTTAEDIKMVLSTAETHTVVLKEFGHGASGSSINYTFTMTRRDLDHMITPLVDRSFKVTQDALALARLTPSSFDKIILVGGSTRMPLVRKRVEAFFGQAPLDRVNPDEVVAIGAAIQAAALTEGARKRSIPAPPNVIGKPRTLPGLASETNENTQTGTIDPAALQGKPPPAFASNPPSFGFHPASSPPPVGGPATKSGPPPSAGATGARTQANATQQGGPRKITSPGVAPHTQPMGARTEAPTSPGHDDDPSIASFPDLAVPTPFEWFPSSGQPSSGDTAVRSGPAGSERSFGGNTLTATGVEQSTLTATVSPDTTPLGPARSRPAAGVPASAGSSAGFGAIDEPPSLMSTPSASVPSFPSMTGGPDEGRMPSPIGEPEAFGGNEVPGGQFGALGDISLVSTTGMAPSSNEPSAELGFGHVADLSLVSTSSATAELDDVTEARQKLLENIDDETEANVRGQPGAPAFGNTLSLDPVAPGGRSPAALGAGDEGVDLPSVAQPTDLPSVVQPKGKRPEIRKPGQPGMTQGGGPSMIGKPPPMMAPQPFGPMEKIGGEGGPPSRTAAMQARPQPQQAPPAAPSSKAAIKGAPARPPAAGQAARTGAMPARTASPMNTTAPLDQTTPLKQAPAGPGAVGSPGPAPFGAGLP
ncbi:MAG TPA: Hsp70 family protein, partial [Labilithrix sp.]|nr:Hsp70 family protein [Labilithrix sp.]